MVLMGGLWNRGVRVQDLSCVGIVFRRVYREAHPESNRFSRN